MKRFVLPVLLVVGLVAMFAGIAMAQVSDTDACDISVTVPLSVEVWGATNITIINLALQSDHTLEGSGSGTCNVGSNDDAGAEVTAQITIAPKLGGTGASLVGLSVVDPVDPTGPVDGSTTTALTVNADIAMDQKAGSYSGGELTVTVTSITIP